MQQSSFSSTYMNLIDLLFKLKIDKVNDTTQTFSGNSLNVVKTGQSDKVKQEITIANDELYPICNKNEWFLLGRIGIELHYGNALWACPADIKDNSQSRTTLASLKKKRIIITTETLDIYIINPFYLRKGDLLKVLTGTAELLINEPKVLLAHVKKILFVKGKPIMAPLEIEASQI